MWVCECVWLCVGASVLVFGCVWGRMCLCGCVCVWVSGCVCACLCACVSPGDCICGCAGVLRSVTSNKLAVVDVYSICRHLRTYFQGAGQLVTQPRVVLPKDHTSIQRDLCKGMGIHTYVGSSCVYIISLMCISVIA